MGATGVHGVYGVKETAEGFSVDLGVLCKALNNEDVIPLIRFGDECIGLGWEEASNEGTEGIGNGVIHGEKTLCGMATEGYWGSGLRAYEAGRAPLMVDCLVLSSTDTTRSTGNRYCVDVGGAGDDSGLNCVVTLAGGAWKGVIIGDIDWRVSG